MKGGFALPTPSELAAAFPAAVRKARLSRARPVFAVLIDRDVEPSPEELSGFCGCCIVHLVWWEVRRWRIDGDEDVHECKRCGAVVTDEDAEIDFLSSREILKVEFSG